MKLTDIHEGMLDNAGKWLRAKLQTLGGNLGDERLRSLVSQASKIEGSILRDSKASKLWWDALLTHYSIPTDRREECVAHVIDIVRRKAAELLSDDPEPYVHKRHNVRGRHTGKHLPHVDWHDLMAHIATDHKRMREDTWSDRHKNDAVYGLVALLAIKEVEKFAKQVNSGQQPRRHPDVEEAQEIAIRLWNYSHHYAIDKSSKLNRPLMQALIDRMKELGYRIKWQGNKTPEYPQGDRQPTVYRQ